MDTQTDRYTHIHTHTHTHTERERETVTRRENNRWLPASHNANVNRKRHDVGSLLLLSWTSSKFVESRIALWPF